MHAVEEQASEYFPHELPGVELMVLRPPILLERIS